MNAVAGYSLMPQPEHGPDCWAAYVRLKTTSPTGELEITSHLLSTRCGLIDTMAQIYLYNAANPVDPDARLWSSPLEAIMSKLLGGAVA